MTFGRYLHSIGSNPTQACRVLGVSRKSYYKWLRNAEQYGLSALLPKGRRTPHQPNAMSGEEVAVILAEAVIRPTLGPRGLLRHLRSRGVERSASGVAKILHRHNLGTARLRVAGLASLTTAETGQLTDAAMDGSYGFCLVCLQSQPSRVPGRVLCWPTLGRRRGLADDWVGVLTAEYGLNIWAAIVLSLVW